MLNVSPLSTRQVLKTSSIFFLHNLLLMLVFAVVIKSFDAMNISGEISFRNNTIFFSVIFCFIQASTSFMMILSCGYNQILSINQFLQRCIQCGTKMSDEEVIRNTSRLYDKLCDVFEATSTYYLFNNLQLLLAFNYFNVFFYYSVYIYITLPNFIMLNFVLTCLMWCLLYTPGIFWMMRFSSRIRAEGCKTANLVQKLANREKNRSSLRCSQGYALLIAHRQLKITCGLYELNWKSFFAILGNIFSFSIIIIQFYDVSKS